VLQHGENPRQHCGIDTIVDDHAMPAHQYDLYPTRRRNRTW
jgi:hypothetical protein